MNRIEYPVVTLKEITESIQYGYTTSADFVNKGLYKFLRITDIQENNVNWDGVPFAEGLNDENEASKYLLQEGDVVFARTGATTGKSYLISKVPSPTVFASYLIRVRPDRSLVTSEYLAYFFQTSMYWRQVEKNKKGAAQAGVNATVLGELKIPLLPIEEQRKITAVLSKVQALIGKRKETIVKLDELIEVVFLDMFGDPVTNPNKYLKQPVKEICLDILGGGTPSKSKPEYYVGNIPWVTPKDMKKLLIQDSIDHINSDAIENSSAKLIPKNSLIMVIRSGILKKKLPLAINQREITINQDMKALVLKNEKVKAEYLLFFFNFYQKVLLSKVRSVTADNIEFNQIKELMVPVPSITEQQKFVDFFNKVSIQQKKEQHNLNQLEIGFQSLLQQAFKGELKINIEITA